ncbi:TPA: hypothetical protein N0F65_004023 [Lagenidium giganteum]|uniref:Uncharacterized protein n=1 Tax=Lagenidium giganteum TaxID=4803 RepID=A0AAV2YTQ2_9STRA|nr:TPA: hypothetical protein N0F65_004023 [Lagenidium giganteum]
MIHSTALLAMTSLLVTQVAAHGTLLDPKPDFSPLIQGYTPSAPCGLIDGAKALPGNAYNQGAEPNTQAFTAAFKASSYKSLKEFVVKNTDYYAKDKECGFTDPTKTSATLPDKITFGDRPGERGFYMDHQGPCELWCDDEVVMKRDNCAKEFDGTPAAMPYEKAKCVGKKKLTFVWMAVHNPKFQVYINCVGLSGAAAPSGSPSTAPATSTPGYSPMPSSASPSPATPESKSPTPAPQPNPATPTKKPGCKGKSKKTRKLRQTQRHA